MINKLRVDDGVDGRWLSLVLDNFKKFVQDHADCERRSSAMALGIVAKHPDRHVAVSVLIELGIKKLRRFQQFHSYMIVNGIAMPPELKHDIYVKQLSWLIKNGKDERLLDRLLISAIVEAREHHRINMLYENLSDENAKKFYGSLLSQDSYNIYHDLAKEYYDEKAIDTRLEQLLEEEGNIVSKLDLAPALH